MSQDTKASGFALTLPSLGSGEPVVLDLGKTRVSEERFHEAQSVSPVTYINLEHTFNESFRELKRHSATVGYQLTLADKALEQAKGEFLIDEYPEMIKDKPKSFDNADIRKAYLMRDPAYLAALDRKNQLVAIAEFLEGKIKAVENVCRYMRKEMDLIIRSGLTNKDLYNTQGKK